MKYTLIATAFATMAASGSTLRIIVQNEFAGGSNALLDQTGATLTTGDVVRLGYFELTDGPTLAGDVFTGFVPISSVLINLGLDGTYSQTIVLDDMIDTPATASQTLQFGLRIFNGATEADSTFFNTVTNNQWRFSFSDADPPPTASEMSLDPFFGDADTAIWEGGSASAFRTSIALVPEPSSTLTVLLGASLLLGSRRRK